MKELIEQLVREEQLPDTFGTTVEQWYLPIAEGLSRLDTSETKLIGIQGSQGSGKSTIAKFIKLILEKGHSLNVAVLSLDDFYLTRSERLLLSKNTHPLLATRGVPGTHDIDLARNTIRQLSEAEPDTVTAIPRFDKSVDDRFPETQWESYKGRADIVILEGWCIGVSAQSEAELIKPINQLETEEDTDCKWRRYVNEALASDFKALFDSLDTLVVIQAPSFECVYEWRALQEQKLKKNTVLSSTSRTMSETELRRFIAHYERLTRRCLDTLKDRADWVLQLDSNHNFTHLRTPTDA